MSSTNAKPQTRQPTAKRARTRSTRKADSANSLTSERIADDLATFRKGGGKIEVLGNTKVFKSMGPMAAASKAKTAAKKAPVKKRA